jgi:hypothetical protein
VLSASRSSLLDKNQDLIESDLIFKIEVALFLFIFFFKWDTVIFHQGVQI